MSTVEFKFCFQFTKILRTKSRFHYARLDLCRHCKTYFNPDFSNPEFFETLHTRISKFNTLLFLKNIPFAFSFFKKSDTNTGLSQMHAIPPFQELRENFGRSARVSYACSVFTLAPGLSLSAVFELSTNTACFHSH